MTLEHAERVATGNDHNFFNSWKLYQQDVKYRFLYETLIKNIYVEQPKGYVNVMSTKSTSLHKALYRLKQALRA